MQAPSNHDLIANSRRLRKEAVRVVNEAKKLSAGLLAACLATLALQRRKAVDSQLDED